MTDFFERDHDTASLEFLNGLTNKFDPSDNILE